MDGNFKRCRKNNLTKEAKDTRKKKEEKTLRKMPLKRHNAYQNGIKIDAVAQHTTLGTLFLSFAELTEQSETEEREKERGEAERGQREREIGAEGGGAKRDERRKYVLLMLNAAMQYFYTKNANRM